MAALTWEEKLAALGALSEAALRMRKPGDWYVSWGVDVGGDGLLSRNYGNGRTPEEAVEETWRQVVDELPSDRFLVVYRDRRRLHVRWSGFMWDPFNLEQPKGGAA